MALESSSPGNPIRSHRKTVCDKESCVCLSYSLPCTDLCLFNCECDDIDQISSDEEDNDSYDDDSYDNSDTEDSDADRKL